MKGIPILGFWKNLEQKLEKIYKRKKERRPRGGGVPCVGLWTKEKIYCFAFLLTNSSRIMREMAVHEKRQDASLVMWQFFMISASI